MALFVESTLCVDPPRQRGAGAAVQQCVKLIAAILFLAAILFPRRMRGRRRGRIPAQTHARHALTD